MKDNFVKSLIISLSHTTLFIFFNFFKLKHHINWDGWSNILVGIECRHGNGAGWGWVLPSPFSYPALIYLPVTLPIPNGDQKPNLIPVLDGFGYTHPIPVMENFFNKNFQSRSQCCNALSKIGMMTIGDYGDR